MTHMLCVMVQADRQRTSIKKPCVHSQAGPCDINGGQNGIATGFSPGISVFPC